MELELDQIDFGLLRLLQNNAQRSNKELAAEVGLAPSSCLERVRRLRRGGYLLGSHAEVDPAKMGIGIQALVAVRLARHEKRDVIRFRDEMMARQEVRALYHLTGDDDFLVHLLARDANHLRDLILEGFTSREDIVRLRTSLVFEYVTHPVLPIYLEGRD